MQHVLPSAAERVARRFEHLVKPRLLALTGSPLVNSLHGVTLVLTVLLLMAPLPFVPLANTLPGIAIILVCLGIAERDGLLLLLGYAVAAVSAVYVGVLLWLVVRAGLDPGRSSVHAFKAVFRLDHRRLSDPVQHHDVARPHGDDFAGDPMSRSSSSCTMRAKFAAAQSGLRPRLFEDGDILLFRDEKGMSPFPRLLLQTHRGLHFAPPILSLNQ